MGLAGRLVEAARIARNAAIDLRHGGLLGTNHLSRGSEYSNSDYRALERIFAGRIRPGDVLVDVGCGYGRVLNHWLRRAPEHRIVGIELDARVAEATRRRLAPQARVEVVTGDASAALPEDGTLFFLFHPFFGADVLARFRDRLAARPPADPPLRVLYYNPQDIEVFRADGRWDVELVDIGGAGAAPFDGLAVISARG